MKFGVKVIGNMFGEPSKRIIGDAVYIDDLMPTESINEKTGIYLSPIIYKIMLIRLNT